MQAADRADLRKLLDVASGGVVYGGLIPNERGYERAKAVGNVRSRPRWRDY